MKTKYVKTASAICGTFLAIDIVCIALWIAAHETATK